MTEIGIHVVASHGGSRYPSRQPYHLVMIPTPRSTLSFLNKSMYLEKVLKFQKEEMGKLHAAQATKRNIEND